MSNRTARPAARLMIAGAVATALAAVVLTGCSSPSTAPTDAPATVSAAPTTLSPDPSTSPTPDATFGFITGIDALVTAGELAVSTVPGSTLVSIDLDDDGAWDVQVVTSDGAEHDLDISADGTTVISGPRQDTDDADDRAEHQARIAAAEIDFAEAAELMIEAVPGGTVRDLSLDTDNSTTVWEGDVIDGSQVKHEVRLDAADGTVLRNEVDD
ncbi:PepSY domain-containing protein [Microbacterium sp. Mu-80]|uniref:PepSY domain-containing protein n=1 Tax=Microbacterium bandirmense TaxID=3122050 RepID=A0ABU8LEF2_9MICO